MGFGFDINKVSFDNAIRKGSTPAEGVKPNGDTALFGNDNKAIGEYGDKLLTNQYQPSFVQAIPKADAAQLSELYSLAGIKKMKQPTLQQYESIQKGVNDFAVKYDTYVTTNNAERLYDSPGFKVLNDIFGIGLTN